MDYSTFIRLASEEISNLYDILAQADFDVDMLSDVLHIYTEDGEYVINLHSASQQIWLSSPLSNAGYFSYSKDNNQWLDKNGQDLRDRLFGDLQLELLPH